MSKSSQNQPARKLLLGCIADDVTGATDLAINLVQGGMSVVQLLDIPTPTELTTIDADAVVVALKTRSIPKDQAIQQSLATLSAFRTVGIERYFFKYCSTFDSTPEGNIGPVAESLLIELNEQQTIFCPAFPRNGRTVYQGHLFVHGQLLNESGMESHPLNPMTDANLVRFLGAQTDQPIGLLDFAHVQPGNVRAKLNRLKQDGIRFVIVDACDDQHLQIIADDVVDQKLVTGGSGIARFLPNAYCRAGLMPANDFTPKAPQIEGRSLIIAGSCSSATNQQIAFVKDRISCWQVDIEEAITSSKTAADRIVAWAGQIESDQLALVYSTAEPERVSELQKRFGAQEVANAIENLLATTADRCVSELGVTKLVIAGGETSGAVVNRLGIKSLRIGPEICAGVPWTEAIGERPLALALKSGNFGGPDFFEQAFRSLL